VKPRLTLFDLDHTLLDGDSDALWCEFLMDQGLLDRAGFAERNAAMERDYAAGTVSVQAFSSFYVGTLAGRSPAQWQPWRERFLHEVVAPRLPRASHALVAGHRRAGDLVVLSTATNRYLTELSAAQLGIEHVIATECEIGADGCFSGRTRGTLNMREGKIERLHAWLADRHTTLDAFDSSFYSDSINDLPLLRCVQRPVAVDPDARLEALARELGWPVLQLKRAAAPH